MTLHFVGLLLAREGALLVSRRVDFVRDTDHGCGCDREGMLVGVFEELPAADSVVSAGFFRRISLIVARMDSFRSRSTIRLLSPLRDERQHAVVFNQQRNALLQHLPLHLPRRRHALCMTSNR